MVTEKGRGFVQRSEIDKGQSFDWGKTAENYAAYRDIYPQEFYDTILRHGLCTAPQRVLDLGTGTGVLPRKLAPYGASFYGTDIAPAQIEQAKRLSAAQGLDLTFETVAAEDIAAPDASFDTVTACTCFFYFDHTRLAPKLHSLLKPGGRLAVLYMAWLPFEDAIAGASEALIVRYNPAWSGRGETRHPIFIPADYDGLFEKETELVFDLDVPFTRERWNGRMLACRGVGASLPQQQVAAFSKEHSELLSRIAPPEFTVLHYAAMTILRRV